VKKKDLAIMSSLLRRIKDAVPLWGFPVIIILIIALTLGIWLLVSGDGKRKSTYSAEGLESRYSFHRWDESEHGPVDVGLRPQGSSTAEAPTTQPLAAAVVEGASASSNELSSGTNVPGPDAVFVFTAYGRAHGVGLCMDGVKYRAIAGQSYQDIINYYYTGVTIGQTDESQTIRVKANDGSIHSMPMKEYLYHLVEEPDDYPTEGLKVLYTAARTYTLSVISRGKHKGEGFDICSSGDCCQAFDPNKSVANYPNSVAAVDATAGQIITYNGSPITAAYCGSCGGHTDNNEDVFGNAPQPYLRAKPDDYCSQSPRFSTTKEISVSDLQSRFDVGDLQIVDLSDRTAGGRVRNAKIVGSGGTKTIKGKEFAEILGFSVTRIDYTFK
jgi:SpoIID/LytB domain protein